MKPFKYHTNLSSFASFCFCLSLTGFCHSKKNLPAEVVADHIYRFTNQYFFGEPVHTYLIETENQIILFDLPEYTIAVENYIKSFKKPAIAILSHGSCGISDGTKWQKKIGLKVYLHEKDLDHPWLRMQPDSLFNIPPNIGKDLEIIHTPGHSAGSVCLLDKRTSSLLSGDTFQANEKGAIVDFTKNSPSSYENYTERLQSCKELLDYDFKHVFPFHYSILKNEGKNSLRNFIINN